MASCASRASRRPCQVSCPVLVKGSGMWDVRGRGEVRGGGGERGEGGGERHQLKLNC